LVPFDVEGLASGWLVTPDGFMVVEPVIGETGVGNAGLTGLTGRTPGTGDTWPGAPIGAGGAPTGEAWPAEAEPAKARPIAAASAAVNFLFVVFIAFPLREL
jgi:hypothetical protein